MSRIVIAGTYDTKATSLARLSEELGRLGEKPITIDTSVFPGDYGCTFSSKEVALRAGERINGLSDRGRAEAVAVMARGAGLILGELLASGRVGALVCMGGSNASTVFSRIAPVLPLGIPKILMATAVAGDTRPIIGANDAVMLYPITDVEGSNSILQRMIERLARTASALKTSETLSEAKRTGRTAALTMYGVTTPCVNQVGDLLSKRGFEPFVFHANGTGGRTVELFARQGVVDLVVDVTIAELANELHGGGFPAGSDRLTNASRCGIPQVVAPGAIDMLAFGPRNTVPDRFKDRQILSHNELVTLVRTTVEECRAVGETLAERLGEPLAPTAVAVPMGGVSMLDKPGEAFWDPEAVKAFRDGVEAKRSESVQVVESESNINDPEFAELLDSTAAAMTGSTAG
ncbi:MAG: Tm-1-like ATP-binding domain-containing protein [Albidovulum sp.]|nr:Tm-1-like ATP-binding domain-containing protein [Albidovulum sp.]